MWDPFLMIKVCLNWIIGLITTLASYIFITCLLAYIVVISALNEISNSIETTDRFRKRAVIKAVRIIRRANK